MQSRIRHFSATPCLIPVLAHVLLTLPVRADDSVKMTPDFRGGMHVTRTTSTNWPRLVAEFEPLRALMLSVGDWQPHHRLILQQIASKTRGHLPLVVLCRDTVQIRAITRWLAETGEEFPQVYLCNMATDTVWLRDFGPIFMQSPKRASILDFFYIGSRPNDDSLPSIWSQRTGAKHTPVSWTLQGGNLMSNGNGLALTTNRIFEDNRIRFQRTWPGQAPVRDGQKIVVEAITQACNLQQLIVLEPLQQEETRHVDMFATFLSPTDVLVARLNPAEDPVNASILERNVNRLRKVRVSKTPTGKESIPGQQNQLLQVHRITIPTRRGTSWSAYTNAILAKDLVLIPTFDDEPPTLVKQAIRTYQQLLPGHTVKTIDMTSMRKLQGELHCLSLHVPNFAPMPRTLYRYEDSVEFYFPNRRHR